MGAQELLKAVEVEVEAEAADYRDDKGLLICGQCHTRRQRPLEVLGREYTVGVLCACRQACQAAEEAQREAQKRQERMEELRRRGFPDRQYQRCRFDTDDRRNAQLSAALERYVERWEEMRRRNLGLLLHGPVGTGKTYFAACIANALIDREIPAQMTSFSRMIHQLQGLNGGRQEYIDRMVSYPLLILDDLGAERHSEFMQEQVLNIVDARYRTEKPLIITTNVAIEEIKNPQTHQFHRIYDRILGMCHPILVPGPSRRRELVKAEYRQRCSTLGLTGPESGVDRVDTQSRA